MIIAKKEELGLYQEVKWTKVTEQYLDKYLNLIDYFFDFVKKNKIKIRIMFRQNAQVPQNLTREHQEKEYFLLYYQFIKHAFGIDYCNQNESDQIILKLYFDKLPDTKRKNKEFKGYIYALNDFFFVNNVHIYNEDEIDEMIMLIRDSFIPAFIVLKDMLVKKLDVAESDWTSN